VTPEEHRAELLWQSYFRPGTTVLANRLDLGDAAELRIAEYAIAAHRQSQIAEGTIAIPRTFDDVHLVAIHRALFSDVYPWAGEARVVGLAKNGQSFASVGHGIAGHVWDAKVASTRVDWAHTDRESFAVGMGTVYASLNAAHPFREGNGRTAKVMLSQLAERSPFALDLTAVSSEEWNQAAAASMRTMATTGLPDPAPMTAVFRAMTVERSTTPAPAAVEQSPALAWAMEQAHRATHTPIVPGLAPTDPAAGPRTSAPQRERTGGYDR
jgi:cell filamentation protein